MEMHANHSSPVAGPHHQAAFGTQSGHEGDVQCSAFFFTPLFLVCVSHFLSVITRGVGNPMVSQCFTFFTFLTFVLSTASGTAVLTYMHLSLGMISVEGALRVTRAPMWAISTRLELFAVFATIVPNLSVVLSESIFWHCQGVNMLACRPRPLDPLTVGSFASNPLYRKQHATLHTAIVFLMMSMGSSYWPRLRKAPKVQLVRMFIDPCCLAAVANILATHDHGAAHHELDSHPMLALIMFAVAATTFFSQALHVAVAPGRDLTVKLENGGGPLLVPRLVNAFSSLFLGNFLYVDSFMEYLGCRTIIIKPGGPDNTSRLGWSPVTELSTYLSITTMLAMGMLTAMVLFNPNVSGLSEYAALSSGEATSLLNAEEGDVEEMPSIKAGKASGLEATPSASSEDAA